jgi:NADP-dependent 3-hydroxy acid dehydrogenase YdfG
LRCRTTSGAPRPRSRSPPPKLRERTPDAEHGDRKAGRCANRARYGGASGIGRALAIALSQTGTAVYVADRQFDLARQVARTIADAGGSAVAADLDVRNRAQFAELVSTIVAATGRLDYLFNTAGIGVMGHASQFSDTDWSDVLDVNLKGVCHGIAAAIPT